MSEDEKKKDDGGNVFVSIVKFEAPPPAKLKPVESRQASEGETEAYLDPPYDLDALYITYERSAALRPCVDAYATNIDGFGSRVEARFSDEDVAEWIEEKIVAEQTPGAEKAAVKQAVKKRMARGVKKQDGAQTPLETAVAAEIEKYDTEASEEYDRLQRLIDFCGVGMSFVELRRRTRADLEICGNAYWEILRPEGGATKIIHAPARFIRLMPERAEDMLTVDVVEHVTAFEKRVVPTRKCFRRYKQIITTSGKEIFFKMFGDPRIMDADTGYFYASEAEMKARAGQNVRPATEMIHFALYSGNSAYGVPRWIGASPSVSGSRECDEVRSNFYADNGIPPMAILISGHTRQLTTEARTAIAQQFREHKTKGSAGYHDVPFIEATADVDQRIVPKIEFHEFQREQGASHEEYDRSNTAKIRAMFRLPKILCGDTTDFNRATAATSIDFAESQVFAPERENFDWWMSNSFLPALGFRLHKIVSIGPQTKDLEAISGPLGVLAAAKIITPGEGRKYVTDNSTLDLPDIDEPWTKRPPEFTLSGRGYDPAADAPEVGPTFTPAAPAPPVAARGFEVEPGEVPEAKGAAGGEHGHLDEFEKDEDPA